MADNEERQREYISSLKPCEICGLKNPHSHSVAESILSGVPPCGICGTKHFEDCSLEVLEKLIQTIDREIVANLNHIDVLKERESRIQAKINQLRAPTIYKPSARKCHICGKPTTEKFGMRSQCLRHTAGKQEMVVNGKVVHVTDESAREVANILDRFLHGKPKV